MSDDQAVPESTTTYNRPGGCAAHGCPLNGSMSESTRGGEGAWYCRFHFGSGHANFHLITTVLRRTSWMLEQADWLERAAPADAQRLIASLQDGEFADLVEDPASGKVIAALRREVGRQISEATGSGKRRASAVGGVGGAESAPAEPQKMVDFLMGVE